MSCGLTLGLGTVRPRCDTSWLMSGTTAAPMAGPRTRLGLGFVGNFFYAVGGKVTIDLAKVKRYTP